MQFAHLITCISHCMAQDEPLTVSVAPTHSIFMSSMVCAWAFVVCLFVLPLLSLTLPVLCPALHLQRQQRRQNNRCAFAQWEVLHHGDIPSSHRLWAQRPRRLPLLGDYWNHLPGWIRRRKYGALVLVWCRARRSDHRESAIFTTVYSGARRTSETETSLSLSWRKFVASSVLFRTRKNGATRTPYHQKSRATAFFCLLRKAIGPMVVHVDKKGIIDGLWKSEGRRLVDSDVGRIAESIKKSFWWRSSSSKHTAQRRKCSQCRSSKNSSLKSVREQMSLQKRERCWTEERWRRWEPVRFCKTERRFMQHREELGVQEWKDCEEFGPKPKGKWTFVNKKVEAKNHRTVWCAAATRYQCVRRGRNSKNKNMQRNVRTKVVARGTPNTSWEVDKKKALGRARHGEKKDRNGEALIWRRKCVPVMRGTDWCRNWWIDAGHKRKTRKNRKMLKIFLELEEGQKCDGMENWRTKLESHQEGVRKAAGGIWGWRFDGPRRFADHCPKKDVWGQRSFALRAGLNQSGGCGKQSRRNEESEQGGQIRKVQQWEEGACGREGWGGCGL